MGGSTPIPDCTCGHLWASHSTGGDACLLCPCTKYELGAEATVDHPAHYTTGEIECIDAIKASMSAEAFTGFLKGNALKYLWRMHLKGKPQEDARKAEWYLSRLQGEIGGDA